jgi:hypothetical protein
MTVLALASSNTNVFMLASTAMMWIWSWRVLPSDAAS